MWEFQLYVFVFGLLATRSVSGFYYGKNADANRTAAQSFCQSIGLRLAVLETLAEYEEAKAFLLNYRLLWGNGDDVWIGLELNFSAPTHSYNWIDGTPLTYASFGEYPWKDSNTPSDDKACVKLDWGGWKMEFKPHDCSASMDFLCEGFHLMTSSVTWNSAKLDCEANNMTLASLPNLDAHNASSLFINVKRKIEFQSSNAYESVWFGLKCTSGNSYYHTDGSGATLTYGSTNYTLPWNSDDPDGCMCGLLKRYDSNNGLYKWTDEECESNSYPYLCKDEFLPIVIPPAPTTTTTTPAQTTTKPWWFVEYSEDGKAIGKNGLTFDKSAPPARFGFIGMAIGFGVFSFIIAVVCMLWFCCIRSKEDYRAQEDSDDEEEEEKRKKVAFTAISAKPHGLQYIA